MNASIVDANVGSTSIVTVSKSKNGYIPSASVSNVYLSGLKHATHVEILDFQVLDNI